MSSAVSMSGNRRRPLAAGVFVLALATAIGVVAATRPSRRALQPQPQARLTTAFTKTLETRGMDAAVEEYRTLRAQGFAGVHESEPDTNSLGYRLLEKGAAEGAVRVFQLNAETHPASANVHDSLGEAYLAAGQKALAIQSYEKAVGINPRMKSAVSALHTLAGRPRPSYRPMVLFHISAGLAALLSGAVAVSLRKGSRGHGNAGTVFSVAMLGMSGSGAFMAFVAPDGKVVNVLMGLLTFYLVATAWSAARRRNGGTGPSDWVGLLAALAIAAALASNGLDAASRESGAKDGAPAAVFFVFGAVALLASVLDLRMIVRGGVFGAGRIARHLWRMCTALFIAVTSLFLGQPQLFPVGLRNSGLLAVPSLLVVIVLVFWLVRVLFTSAYKRAASAKVRMPVGQPAT